MLSNGVGVGMCTGTNWFIMAQKGENSELIVPVFCFPSAVSILFHKPPRAFLHSRQRHAETSAVSMLKWIPLETGEMRCQKD